jgi:nitroreductase
VQNGVLEKSRRLRVRRRKPSSDVWLDRHVMIVVTAMMLVAEAYGFDTAPMEGFDPSKLKEAFEIPKEAEVVALLAIGRLGPRARDSRIGGCLRMAGRRLGIGCPSRLGNKCCLTWYQG